jgi:hypothetical protein
LSLYSLAVQLEDSQQICGEEKEGKLGSPKPAGLAIRELTPKGWFLVCRRYANTYANGELYVFQPGGG